METGGIGFVSPSAFDCIRTNESYEQEIKVGANDFPTIREALDEAVAKGWSDVRISVAPGHQESSLDGDLGVFERALIVSEEAYAARIVAIDLSGGDLAQNITFEGFEFGDAPGIVIKMDGGKTTNQNIHHITFRNNVIHDSGSSDTVKINAGCNHITFDRNVLYGHHDDAMDLNSVEHVFVHDNIFFDVVGDRQLLVIKDSTVVGDEDFYKSTQYAYVQRNIFLNWRGGGNSMMVYLGEDNDRDEYAVQNALVENNLFLGNGDLSSGFAAPIGLRGVRDITIRNNTFNGAFQGGRSWAFLAWAITSPDLLKAEDLYIYNNAWVANQGVGTNRFSKSDADLVGDFLMTNNLFWNGGTDIPQSDQGIINYTADANALTSDPGLPDVPAQISLPIWNRKNASFDDGSKTICEAFEKLVSAYAQPASSSSLIDGGVANVTSNAGDISSATDITTDIRARARVGLPDVGAVEVSP